MNRRRVRWLAGLTTLTMMALAALILFVVDLQNRGPSVGQEFRLTVDPGDECGRFDFEIKGWTFRNNSGPPSHSPMTGVFEVTQRRDGFARGVFRPDVGFPVDMNGGPDRTPDKPYCFIER